MSLRNDDDALYFLERFNLKVRRVGMRHVLNPEGKPAWRDTIYLSRAGKQVRAYVFADDFRNSVPKARLVHGMSLVLFADRPYDRFKWDARQEGIPAQALRREWLAWHKLAKPLRAFLTAEECAALS